MKSIGFLLFFLLILPISLMAEEAFESKGMVATTSSSRIVLFPLNSSMTDEKLEATRQTTIVAMNELKFDLIMYESERRELLREIIFSERKASEDARALNKIISDHNKLGASHNGNYLSLQREIDEFLLRPESKRDKKALKSLLDKLSSAEQKLKDIELASDEISVKIESFKASSARQISYLQAKISGWVNGNSMKFELTIKQAREVDKYADRLNKILSTRRKVDREQIHI